MRTTTRALRRGLLCAVFAAVSAGGVAVVTLTMPSAPSATAAPDPCAASEVAKTLGSVATTTGNYLDTHPQTNQALSNISQQQPGPQSLGTLKNYFDTNPQAGKDMQQLQQPLVTLSARCKLPLTLPQLMGLMQNAQQSVGAPAALPGAQSTVQKVGPPAATSPAQSSAASSASQGVGAFPVPSIAGLP